MNIFQPLSCQRILILFIHLFKQRSRCFTHLSRYTSSSIKRDTNFTQPYPLAFTLIPSRWTDGISTTYSSSLMVWALARTTRFARNFVDFPGRKRRVPVPVV
jgi:hypothetical protein